MPSYKPEAKTEPLVREGDFSSGHAYDLSLTAVFFAEIWG
jgi:hypothetical protein